jgi:hypothetical protein
MKTIDSLRFFQITMISSFFDSTILKELELAKNFKNFKELPNIGMYYVLVAFGLSFLVIFPKYFFGGQNSSSVQDIHIGNCTLNPTHPTFYNAAWACVPWWRATIGLKISVGKPHSEL